MQSLIEWSLQHDLLSVAIVLVLFARMEHIFYVLSDRQWRMIDKLTNGAKRDESDD